MFIVDRTASFSVLIPKITISKIGKQRLAFELVKTHLICSIMTFISPAHLPIRFQRGILKDQNRAVAQLNTILLKDKFVKSTSLKTTQVGIRH